MEIQNPKTNKIQFSTPKPITPITKHNQKHIFTTQFNSPESEGIQDFEPSLTRQEFAAECDINKIVHQAKTYGLELPQITPTFADVSDTTEYQKTMEFIKQAESQFNQLPAIVRHRFNHNPAALLDFLSDVRNKSEAIELGLIEKPIQTIAINNPPEPSQKSQEPTK